ncbi:hypothetical protein ABIB40_000029 [Pedobacter sp. UYP30]
MLQKIIKYSLLVLNAKKATVKGRLNPKIITTKFYTAA